MGNFGPKTHYPKMEKTALRWLYLFDVLPISQLHALFPNLSFRTLKLRLKNLVHTAGIALSGEFVYATAGLVESDRTIDALWVMIRLGCTDPTMVIRDVFPAQVTFILDEKCYRIIVLHEDEYWALNLVRRSEADKVKYIIVVPSKEAVIDLNPPGERYIFAMLKYTDGPFRAPSIEFFSDHDAAQPQSASGLDPQLLNAFGAASKALEGVKEQFELAEKAISVSDAKALNHYLTAAELEAERLTVRTRQLPVYTSGTKGKGTVRSLVQRMIPVTMGYTAQGWFCVRFPLLLPHKSKGNVDYIRGFLWDAMNDFFANQPGAITRRVDPAVLIFRHCYDYKRAKRGWRDHDNMEVSIAADIVAEYLLVSDHPTHCSNYETSTPSASERTEIYVVPKDDFPRWLAAEPTFPDEGVPLSAHPSEN